MTERVKTLPLLLAGENDVVEKIFVRPQALMRYSAPDMTTTDGTLWVWEHKGKPVAVTAVFLDSRPDFRWNYECVSLTNDRFSVESPRGWKWTPKEKAHAWLKVDSDAPAATPVKRLAQMRAVARTFSGYQDLDGNKQEYRLLPQPVLRYSAAEDGILDGALFLFVSGTNPEIVAQLEATSEPNEWRVAFARQSAAQLAIRKDEVVIWEVPRIRKWDPTDSYFSHYGPDE